MKYRFLLLQEKYLRNIIKSHIVREVEKYGSFDDCSFSPWDMSDLSGPKNKKENKKTWNCNQFNKMPILAKGSLGHFNV